MHHPSLSILQKPFTIMGIVNVTPDSFFDNGAHASVESAIAHGLKLVADGADVLDIGGESTRPGAAAVDATEEIRRVVLVIRGLAARTSIPISIDTTKAAVAAAALDAGAVWVNDISAGRMDGDMVELVAHRQCPVVFMHSRKTPSTMQVQPAYDDVVKEVCDELLDRVNLFIRAGVLNENIIIDPGIGFAKRFEDNIVLLQKIDKILKLGFPLLLGTSRKSFIGTITGKSVENRLAGSLATVAHAFLSGVRFFRVHDVAETVDLLKVLAAIR